MNYHQFHFVGWKCLVFRHMVCKWFVPRYLQTRLLHHKRLIIGFFFWRTVIILPLLPQKHVSLSSALQATNNRSIVAAANIVRSKLEIILNYFNSLYCIVLSFFNMCILWEKKKKKTTVGAVSTDWGSSLVLHWQRKFSLTVMEFCMTSTIFKARELLLVYGYSMYSICTSILFGFWLPVWNFVQVYCQLSCVLRVVAGCMDTVCTGVRAIQWKCFVIA